MREVVCDYEFFKANVDLSKPIHHCAYQKCVDRKYGVLYKHWFIITGIPRKPLNSNHIICFYTETTFRIGENDRVQKWFNELVEKYAKPLSSTEGEWKE